METSTGALRVRILFAIIMTAILAAGGLWVQTQTSGDSRQSIEADLLTNNKNDGKDGCANDGNAGRGNDDKGPGGGCRQHPPTGPYGSIPGDG